MTGQRPPDRGPSRNRDLGFDEFIAILVAFAAIGSVLFWGLTRNRQEFGLTDFNMFAGTERGDRSLVINPDEEGTARIVPDRPVATASPPATTLVPEPAPPRSRAPVVRRSAPEVEPRRTVPVVVAPPVAAEATEFADVPAEYWARPFIVNLSQRGILTGFNDGTFRPDQAVTRAEYATIIQEILPPAQQEPIDFNDVPADFWAYESINQSVRAGFLRGYPEGDFQPLQPISRVQVLASLSNGLGLPQPDSPGDVVQRYSDREQIPEWAIPTVATATQAGLVANYPSPEQLEPNQPATRAEVAALIYQALAASGQVEPIQSEYTVRP